MTDSKHQLTWDIATGYDFFISLHVLHSPDKFALRASWAKGVRTRLPAQAREFLEEVSDLLLSALPWVHGLPQPKNAKNILAALKALPEKERFVRLLLTSEIPPALVDVLMRVLDQQSWSEADFTDALEAGAHYKDNNADLKKMLDIWANGALYGARLLDALQVYYEVFFEEEETRLQPALEEAVVRGQEMAAELSFSDLLAELSEGIRFEDRMLEQTNWVMVPSFWITPRVLITRLDDEQGFFIHGGRSEDASIVPGEAVPDALYVTLKALADPTRLRILHYLQQQPQTPSELAKTLRLRAPTVIHHLNSLRLAGLVYVTYGKGDKRYAARTARVDEMYLQLRRYLGVSELKRLDDLSGRPPYIA